MMFMFGLIVGLVGGGAAIWVGKEQLQLFYKNGTDIAVSLEAKAAALRAKL